MERTCDDEHLFGDIGCHSYVSRSIADASCRSPRSYRDGSKSVSSIARRSAMEEQARTIKEILVSPCISTHPGVRRVNGN